MMRLLWRLVTLLAAFGLGKRLSGATRPVRVKPALSGGPEEDRKTRWKRRAVKAGVGLAGLGVLGFLVVVSGVVPIKASSGHWGITAWFLHFSMKRSVATHTIGMTAPPLDDPALVLKGAGHYETGCRPCHGSPALQQPRIAAQMTAHPPYLPPRIPEWEDVELFYLVKHGVKFTGMPAWPALERDDEVWAVVAFLRVMPELDEAAYRELVHGPVEAGLAAEEDAPIQGLIQPMSVPPAVVQNCGRCHGVDGLGRGEGAFPRLAGQQAAYLDAALRAYALGERHSGIMEPVAAGLTLDEVEALARYYASLPPSPPAALADTVDAAAVERGRAIARYGLSRAGVPSCADCHGPGNTPRNPFYPRLAGQYADYLVLQLELFKEDHRGGSPYASLMKPAVHRLSKEEMRAVASYYASLPAEAALQPPPSDTLSVPADTLGG